MSESILHVITQDYDDFDDLTMMNHPFVTNETNHDVTANFDHVQTSVEPPIHPFFSKQFKPSNKSGSPRTNVKGYYRKNGVFVDPYSRAKPVKKGSKNSSKLQKVKPFSAKVIRVDPELLMLQHKFNIEDAKKEQQKRKSNS